MFESEYKNGLNYLKLFALNHGYVKAWLANAMVQVSVFKVAQ